MPTYSLEIKEQIVRKMMPPNSQSVAHLSRETGISTFTLYAWKRQFQNRGFVVPANPSSPERWDARAKLAAIIQSAAMNEAERSAYCRENGLYPEQLNAWKEAFETQDSAGARAEKALLAAERKKIRTLERELLRKERALAEVAALLTLSKKAQAIWDSDGEDGYPNR